MSVTIPPDIFKKSFLLYISPHSLRTTDKPTFDYIHAMVEGSVRDKAEFTEHRVYDENPDLTFTRVVIREVTMAEIQSVASKVSYIPISSMLMLLSEYLVYDYLYHLFDIDDGYNLIVCNCHFTQEVHLETHHSNEKSGIRCKFGPPWRLELPESGWLGIESGQ